MSGQKVKQSPDKHMNKFSNSVEVEKDEIVIGLVAAVGTDLDMVVQGLKKELREYDYVVKEIRISSDLLQSFVNNDGKDEIERINEYMTAGNKVREVTGMEDALALMCAASIFKHRVDQQKEGQKLKKIAWVIRSLKNPQEVQTLRRIYGHIFFAISVYSSNTNREFFLAGHEPDEAKKDAVKSLLERDLNEKSGHGQKTRDTFQQSDFFIQCEDSTSALRGSVERIMRIIFGDPFVTPTFDEYAMYMAFTAATRSADLSRQVGAVVAKENNILSTGANDVPKFGGGLYWPVLNTKSSRIEDVRNGRDYTRNADQNSISKREIIDSIVSKFNDEDTRNIVSKVLNESAIKDLTEFGRVVHAEMEAILSVGRTNNSTVGTHLYCTTFPCHNCAKHIVAAGVLSVTYIEPYPKSKALDFHDDSITFYNHREGYVTFKPFVGVGPKHFLNFFSMGHGLGTALRRKQGDGKVVTWNKSSATLRMQSDEAYTEREMAAAKGAPLLAALKEKFDDKTTQ